MIVECGEVEFFGGVIIFKDNGVLLFDYLFFYFGGVGSGGVNCDF